jgi:hypothetical protein
MRNLLCAALVLFVLAGAARTVDAYSIERGSSELRPLIGATGSLDNRQPTQFQMGLDWNYSLDGPLGFVLGWWLGFAQDYVGLEITLGVKYRFLNLHPRVAPFIGGGGGFSAGFRTLGNQGTVTGLGFRFGGGVDFFATPRIIPGMQIMFDLGPGFSPAPVGFMGSVQITFGCGFLI